MSVELRDAELRDAELRDEGEMGAAAPIERLHAAAAPRPPDPMPTLRREDVLARFAQARAERRREPVDVAEWGARVYVREVPARLRLRLEDLIDGSGAEQGSPLEVRCAELFSLCIVGEDDAELFSPSDAAQIGELSSRVIRRLHRAIARVNALGESEVKRRVGESEAVSSGGSSTGSPGPVATPIRDGS